MSGVSSWCPQLNRRPTIAFTMICRARGPHAYAEVEFPPRRYIQVGCGEELLLLVAKRVESCQVAVGSVIFDPRIYFLCEVIPGLTLGEKVIP